MTFGMTIRLHETERSEPVARPARIQKYIDILLRKEESSAMISAMRNSIAENSATHADEHYDRARCARILQPERVLAGGRKFFVLNPP
jgi:hypothetical protein